MESTLLAILIVGFAAGLRAMTPTAIIAWCGYLGMINLDASIFSFMSSPIALVVFSFLAIGEYVGDLLPSAPNRTALPGLIARVITGTFSAACLLAAATHSLGLAFLGGVGAICGAFIGYESRVRLVKKLNVQDSVVAIPEDIIAIAISVLGVFLAAPR